MVSEHDCGGRTFSIRFDNDFRLKIVVREQAFEIYANQYHDIFSLVCVIYNQYIPYWAIQYVAV